MTTKQTPGFQLLRLLGEGGFGQVWLARDTILQQERFAIKLLHSDRFAQDGVGRLAEEARIMGGLPRHRNRVQVHALFSVDDTYFLVMEYIDGGPLSKQTSRQQPLSWERAARYVGDVADGLQDVHAAGLLHRDIKPANILWDRRSDEALLADFGIAAHIAQAGNVAGTPGYIAPELFDGKASPKSDVFALAATLFHLVAGRPPFATGDLLAGYTQAQEGLRWPVEDLGRVPPAIEKAIRAGLEPDVDRRADLPTFLAMLRGAHLQGLADRLLQMSHQSGCQVKLQTEVSTASESDLVFRPIACQAPPLEATRDMDYVPEPAPEAVVQTGDLVRLEITADADGYLTIVNLGSSGDLNVIFPNPRAKDNRIHTGRPHRLTVKLTPPDGTDRAAVIWTREPHELTPGQWRDRIESGQVAALGPEEATRGMDFVLHEAAEHRDWVADVVAITHGPPGLAEQTTVDHESARAL